MELVAGTRSVFVHVLHTSTFKWHKHVWTLTRWRCMFFVSVSSSTRCNLRFTSRRFSSPLSFTKSTTRFSVSFSLTGDVTRSEVQKQHKPCDMLYVSINISWCSTIADVKSPFHQHNHPCISAHHDQRPCAAMSHMPGRGGQVGSLLTLSVIRPISEIRYVLTAHLCFQSTEVSSGYWLRFLTHYCCNVWRLHPHTKRHI